jgi:ribosomal protein S18 acetylase RimI-like enzyme
MSSNKRIGKYQIRSLNQDDFDTLMALEDVVFASEGESVLCAYYVRLCCEFFSDTCFVALDGGRAVGYVLCFLRDREAYCTTLAVHPDYQGTKVVVCLLRALTQRLVAVADSCWFTVKEDNQEARTMHEMLGAREEEIRKNFYGPGDDRIVSRIDRVGFERMRKRYERLRLVEETAIEKTA